MKLIRLHLQGFKSFKDRTTIQFDEGITGIVGPNGCGKSNIVDALFWVMGEQSAKHLRGTKMKDLIFAGSSKYTPGSFAEVTLVLENDTGKHIHIGSQVSKPAEIALTRKLYRNGETEYRINGTPARLKDIHEVFMDTGAGAKSYSIIAQGEINRLVQAKPEERRTMIEEVAGITKFKLRKKDSLKKIEQTQSNLNRLSDLQSEIYKNLKSLEKQAEKAEKARRLKDRVKHHGLIVDSHKEFDYLNDFVNANTILQNNKEVFEESELKKEAIELALEDERNKKTDLMDKIDLEQADFNEMSKELAASEERLKYLKNTRADKERLIESKTQENTELEHDIEERKAKVLELNEKLDEIKSANYEDLDFTALEEKASTLKEELTDKEESFKEISRIFEETKTQLNDADQLAFKNNSKLEEYATSLEDIAAEIEEIEKNTANFSDELVELRRETQTTRDELDSIEESYKVTKEKFNTKKETLKSKDNEHRSLSKEVIALDSKRQSLIEINKTGEGVKRGALDFIEKSNSSFEILGNLIECEADYAKALEVMFENSFDALIGKDKDFSNLADWAKSSTDMSFDFINLTNDSNKITDESIERLKLKGLSGITAINDVLKINNKEYSEALNSLFNGYFVVDNLTSELALKLTADLNFKGLVSKDGHIYLVKNNGALKLSARTSDSTSMGVVQRNNLINEMTLEFDTKNETLQTLESEIQALEEEVSLLSIEFENISSSLNETTTKYAAFKASLDSKEKTHGGVSSRLEILQNRKSEISKARLELLEKEESTLNSKESLEQKIDGLSDSMESSRVELEDFKSEYETQRSELLELQANAKTFETQLTSIESQIEDVNSQVQKYSEKFDSNNNALDEIEAQIEQAEESVSLLESENSDKADTMGEKESYLNIIKDELTSLLTGMQEREGEVKELTAQINKIEKMNVELNLKAQQIIIDEEILVKNAFDLHKVNLRDTLMSSLEIHSSKLEDLADLSAMNLIETEEGQAVIDFEEYKFEKRFPAALRESKEKYKRYRADINRLGEINWQAIEDYERQKLRYDFLKTQETELKQSLEDLETAIAHIDEKSKVRFKEAFNEVNIRFEKVFPIIFGGGEARLEVVGDINSTECGIDIIAKPPGKKMQSINLMSGGEKAMTAVSLIFSIFLVKPSPFCLLDEVDAPLDDANVGRFNELLREMSSESQFILITHNKKTMELNDTLYGVTMQEPGVSKAVSVQLH